MGIVGVGFVGPHHIDAVRRLGYVDVVAVADMNEKLAREKADALHVPKAYGSYRGAARRSGHAGRPQRDAELPALSGQRRRDRQGQARRLRQAAGDDRRRSEEARRSGDQGRRRARRDVRLSRQPARAARAAAIARGEIGRPNFMHGYYLQDWLLKDTDYSWRLEPGQGRRVVRARRHRIALVRPGAAHQRPAYHARARRHHDGHPEAQEADGRARGVSGRRQGRRLRAGGHQGRGSRVSARAVRQRREGELLGRPGLRRPQERSRARGVRVHGFDGLAAGAPERAVDRPSRQGQRDPAEGSLSAR